MNHLGNLISKADLLKAELCLKCDRVENNLFQKQLHRIKNLQEKYKKVRDSLNAYKKKIFDLENRLNASRKHREQMKDVEEFVKRRVTILYGPKSWQNIWSCTDAPSQKKVNDYRQTVRVKREDKKLVKAK